MNQTKLGLPKKEHLTGDISITHLFKKGRAFLVYPIRVMYIRVPKETEPIKVLFSVPKRQFKHAVDRNHFKRLMRETYRLNKVPINNLVVDKEYSLHIAFLAVSNKIPDFQKLNTKMQLVLDKITDSVTCENS